jgi:mgtE-like transporter
MEVVAMTVRTSIAGLAKSLGQSLLSLSFNPAGLLAGTFLAIYFDVFRLAPWTLALFPGILSIRGAIGGLFSGRLSTGLHLGTIKPSYTENTREFHLLFYSIVTLTLVSSIVVGLGASLFGVFLWGASIIDFFSIIVVASSTMGVSILFISPITIAVSALSFRRGLDPDVTIYPVMATVADILVTLCYILELNVFFYLSPLGGYLIGLTSIIFLSIVIYIVYRNAREERFVKTIKEFFTVLILVAFIVNVTGSLLNEIRKVVGSRPGIFVAYPALINTVGAVGSIVGSTATTKLFLGMLKSSFSSIKQHLTEIGGAWIASMVMFMLYSVFVSFAGGTATFNVLSFMAQFIITNVLAVSAIVVISYTVAILTYRRGWDSDNFVIPIESSLADSITTISLLIALNSIG